MGTHSPLKVMVLMVLTDYQRMLVLKARVHHDCCLIFERLGGLRDDCLCLVWIGGDGLVFLDWRYLLLDVGVDVLPADATQIDDLTLAGLLLVVEIGRPYMLVFHSLVHQLLDVDVERAAAIRV